MSNDNGPSVLAIGIDATEGTLVRKLIEQDKLPVLLGGEHKAYCQQISCVIHLFEFCQ